VGTNPQPKKISSKKTTKKKKNQQEREPGEKGEVSPATSERAKLRERKINSSKPKEKDTGLKKDRVEGLKERGKRCSPFT